MNLRKIPPAWGPSPWKGKKAEGFGTHGTATLDELGGMFSYDMQPEPDYKNKEYLDVHYRGSQNYYMDLEKIVSCIGEEYDKNERKNKSTEKTIEVDVDAVSKKINIPVHLVKYVLETENLLAEEDENIIDVEGEIVK